MGQRERQGEGQREDWVCWQVQVPDEKAMPPWKKKRGEEWELTGRKEDGQMQWAGKQIGIKKYSLANRLLQKPPPPMPVFLIAKHIYLFASIMPPSHSSGTLLPSWKLFHLFKHSP